MGFVLSMAGGGVCRFWRLGASVGFVLSMAAEKSQAVTPITSTQRRRMK